MANGKQELQETLEEWNGLFTRHGLNINLEKTDVLHIGHQREELDIELEGNKLTQGDSFLHLGGAVCGDGKTEREVRRRAQTGANAWRAFEGVMAARRISRICFTTCLSQCECCTFGRIPSMFDQYTESHYPIINVSSYSGEFVIKMRNNVTGFVKFDLKWNLTNKVTHGTEQKR